MTEAYIYDERTLPLWSDNPAQQDLLGFADVARPIVSAIRRERLNPVSIGLVGPWGSGKTTILRLVEAELDKSTERETGAERSPRRVLVVNTSPWEYDPKLDIKATLIGDVLDAIRVEATERGDAGTRMLGVIKDLAKKVRWSKAITLAAKTALTVQVPSLADIEGIFKLDDGDGTKPEKDPTLSGFKAEFARALSEFDIERVVVLVDDLDRCLPEAVVSTLEGIKLFLTVPKMAFVIAYDEAPVVEAIRERYPNNASSERMAKQYLEKIVQVPVRVPRLSADGVRTYLTLTMLDRRVDATELQSMITYANGRRQRGETPVLDGHGVQIADDASDAVRLAERLAPVLYAPLEGNPRRLKRFLNDYWMRSATAGSRNIDLDADALAKLMVLEQLHETQFAEVVRWSAEGLAGERLQAIESDEVANLESWAMPELRVWARLEPQLAGLNLGQYMELAASLRAIPFSGVGLPPELQAILAKLTSNNPVVRKAGQTEAKELDAALRVPLALALIDLLPRVGSRRGELAEAIPDLVNGSDEVGKAIVESVRKLDPGVVEPALMVRLSSCSVPTTSVFLVEAREDMRYSDSVRKAIPEPKKR